MARKYELQRRAQRQEETRLRIVEAAVYLHQTVGGAKASITAIAELAGVERLTVGREIRMPQRRQARTRDQRADFIAGASVRRLGRGGAGDEKQRDQK